MKSNVKLKVINFLSAKNYLYSYIIVGIIAVSAYYFIRALMLNMNAWAFVKTSPLTMNMLLAFFMWGWFVDYRFKKMSKYKKLALDMIGIIILIILLRFGGGIKTIFG